MLLKTRSGLMGQNRSHRQLIKTARSSLDEGNRDAVRRSAASIRFHPNTCSSTEPLIGSADTASRATENARRRLRSSQYQPGNAGSDARCARALVSTARACSGSDAVFPEKLSSNLCHVATDLGM